MKRSKFALVGILFFGLMLIINLLFEVSVGSNKTLGIFIIIFSILFLFQNNKEKITAK